MCTAALWAPGQGCGRVGAAVPRWLLPEAPLQAPSLLSLALQVFRVQSLTCVAQVTWPFYLRNMMVIGGATAASLCFGNAGAAPPPPHPRVGSMGT